MSSHLSSSPSVSVSVSVLLAALALSACGGGDDAVITPPVAGNPPPATVSTTVTGAVVKGPVAAAQVCGYTVAANARGAALGSCTTSDASGNYSLTVPAGSGPLWVEATGGSYTDETTGTATSLPAGSALRSIVTANGGSVTSMLTPLTTLALNAAAASAGSAGTLDTAAFSAAASVLISSFKLPADLNISSTRPAFGSGINSYGTALTAISKMIANGQTLASILATAHPSTLAAAYATAATPTVPPVAGGGTGGGTLGPITATGSVTGSTTETFVPRAAAASGEPAFSTLLTARGEGYTFVNTNATGLTTQVFSYSVTRGQPSSGTFAEYTYTGGVARTVTRVCKAPCAGITLTPTASGTGVTLTFTNASFELTDFGTTLPNPPTAPTVMNGSLTGETPGGYVFAAQMPRGTTGTLTLDGVATPIFFADISYPTSPSITDPLAYPIVALNTARGTFTVDRRPESPPYFAAAFISKPEGEGLVKVVTADALTSTANGYAITLTNLAMTGRGPVVPSLNVTAQVNTGKAGGTVTIAGDDSFTARLDILQGQNQTLFYNFRGTSKTLAFSNIDVQIKNGAVTYFNANSPSGKGYTCDSVGSLFSAKCVGSINVSADKRTLTFNGFKAGKTMTPDATVAFEGSLTAAGF